MLLLKIITPKKLVFEGDVDSVTVPTVEGEITVLQKHANLLSLLKEGVVTIKKSNVNDYLSIGGGYIQTNGKTIHLLVSRAYGQEELNEERLKEAIKSAQSIVKNTKDKQEREAALSNIRRSLLDMKLLSKVRRKKST